MRKSLLCWLLVMGMVGSIWANPGYLVIKNNLNSRMRNVNINRDDTNLPGAMDGHDFRDAEANTQPNGYPNLVSNIGTHNLWSDVRAENSIADYDIRLSFRGSLPSTQSNWLILELEYDGYKFGNKQILFQSEALPFGKVVDVRKAINQNGGVVPLVDAPAGTSGNYASGILTIGTRKLADLSDNGVINLEDFTLLAMDWGKTGVVGSPADITGPFGIPDGNVDMYDLREFMSQWLE